MSIRFLYLLLAGMLVPALLVAQKNCTISGTLKDKESGETLFGASVYQDGTTNGASTNEYGFYSLTLPCGDSVSIVFTYTGMSSQLSRFYLSKDTMINVEMSSGVEIQEIQVTASSNREQVNSTQMGVAEVSIKEAKELPAIFGEVDIIKVLQLKPGVQSGGEGTSGIYVRGGGSDQNLFILDEAPVYNPNHLFGFFSTFNSDAVKSVKLYKAGFPAEYGGKLSSVIDVLMKEGNRKRFSGAGGLGLIASRLTLEGPIVKDKGSFIVSGRRTYVDLFTRLINKANEDKPNYNKIPDYSFYDLNAKLNYDIGDKDRLFLSGYYGRDIFFFKSGALQFNFNWGNATATARWNHIINPQLFVNTAFTFSDYQYIIKNKFDEFEVELGSGIRDMNLKSDFSWFPNKKHSIKFGANTIYHRFLVNRFNANNNETDDIDIKIGKNYHALETAAYISDDWTISKRLTLNFGGRFSGFYNFSDITDSTTGKFYGGFEPRAALKLTLLENDKHSLSLKANYSRMYQYIHLVATSGALLPTDVWYPSNTRVKPEISDLVSLGLAWAPGKDFFISVEGYYKWLYNQIDFKDGASLFVNDDLDGEFVFGKGSSYGAEFYVEKKAGAWRGWIGYTLSWSWRQFDDIMDGKPFHPSYDRRHDVVFVISYDIPKTPLTLSATWVYGTGKAVSLPVSRFFTSDIVGSNPIQFNPIFTERNGFRMPPYHRADIGLVWRIKTKNPKRLKSDLTLSVYNLYNRRNPFFLFIDAEYADDNGSGIQIPQKFQAKVVSLFPIIPSLTWNFSF